MSKFYDMKLGVWFEEDIYNFAKFTLYINELILQYGYVSLEDVWDNVKASDSFKDYISNNKQDWMSDGDFEIINTVIDTEAWPIVIESTQELAYKFIWIYRRL